MSERRGFTRVAAGLRGRWAGENPQASAEVVQVEDLSLGGALLSCDGEPLEAGCEAWLILEPEAGPRVDVRAYVVRVVSKTRRPVMAVRFLDAHGDVRLQLANALLRTHQSQRGVV